MRRPTIPVVRGQLHELRHCKRARERDAVPARRPAARSNSTSSGPSRGSASHTNYDIYLLDDAGNVLVKQRTAVNPGAGRHPEGPSRLFTYDNTLGVSAGACGWWSATPAAPPGRRMKWTMTQPEPNGVLGVVNERLGPATSPGPAIFGHNGTGAGMSVAAVPFSNSGAIEEFSSRGPVTHYFGPVIGTTPAAPLASPQVLAKPDIAATDGGASDVLRPVASTRGRGASSARPSPRPKRPRWPRLSCRPHRARPRRTRRRS